jgi:hypothetical protein
MAGEDKLLIGAGILGLGFLAWKAYEKRKEFQERLKQGLSVFGVNLVYPDLGFLPDGRHVWHLTIDGPGGAVTLNSPLHPGTDPYALSTADDLAMRVHNWIVSAA